VFGQRAIFALDPERRSRLNGLFMASFFIGGARGSALSGWCYAVIGCKGVALLGAALPVLGLLYFATECFKPNPPNLRQEDTRTSVAQGHVVHSAGGCQYVARMEDVIDLYAEAPNPKQPVVCFDESPTQLIDEVRQPIAAKPGQRERYDYEYKRNGTVNLFVFLDAHRPWRKVTSTFTIQGPSEFASSWTISRRTRPVLSTRPFRRPKHDGYSAAWNFTMCPSTPAG
jgi:hypothetical protein